MSQLSLCEVSSLTKPFVRASSTPSTCLGPVPAGRLAGLSTKQGCLRLLNQPSAVSKPLSTLQTRRPRASDDASNDERRRSSLECSTRDQAGTAAGTPGAHQIVGRITADTDEAPERASQAAVEHGAQRLGKERGNRNRTESLKRPRGRQTQHASMSRRGLLGLGASAVGLVAAQELGLVQAAAAAVAEKAPVAEAKKAGLLGGETPFAEKPKESRVYDASVLGEPLALTSKDRVWQRMLGARVVYLGEAERVHDPSDKVLELEIIKKLRDECFAQARPVTVAMSAFPRTMQDDLAAFFGRKVSEEELKAKVPHWVPGRWEETLPILRYCRDNGVRLYAVGVPPEVLRTVQSQGIHGLSANERKKYAPSLRSPMPGSPPSSVKGEEPTWWLHGIPDSSPFQRFLQSGLAEPANAEGILPKTSHALGPGPFLFAQARVVEQHTMTQGVTQAMTDGGAVGMLIVITGASHVVYGARGRGVPAKIQDRLKKSTQCVVLLNPERQVTRTEGSLPEGDYLWYTGTRACTRNCFDRAEVARVMGAAGRTREGLPQDLQMGIERGLISPQTLQSFFELDSHPWVAEATKRFQGLRERFYADPKFLHRLCIEESISITTTLIAQYQKRKERFWSEIEYVATDTFRGAVVDFFTVWLPAPTLSFDSRAMGGFDALKSSGGGGTGFLLHALRGWVGSLPDNAFQRAGAGQEWGLVDRVAAVVLGGAKLFSVGFVSSIGTVGVTNTLMTLRQKLRGNEGAAGHAVKRSPVMKTALVYASFLGTSANLRYQMIAGLVEHWIADELLVSQPALGAALSFVARTANSYWGTGQWVDLAHRFGLQAHADESPSAGRNAESGEVVGEGAVHGCEAVDGAGCVLAEGGGTPLAHAMGAQVSTEMRPQSSHQNMGVSQVTASVGVVEIAPQSLHGSAASSGATSGSMSVSMEEYSGGIGAAVFASGSGHQVGDAEVRLRLDTAMPSVTKLCSQAGEMLGEIRQRLHDAAGPDQDEAVELSRDGSAAVRVHQWSSGAHSEDGSSFSSEVCGTGSGVEAEERLRFRADGPSMFSSREEGRQEASCSSGVRDPNELVPARPGLVQSCIIPQVDYSEAYSSVARASSVGPVTLLEGGAALVCQQPSPVQPMVRASVGGGHSSSEEQREDGGMRVLRANGDYTVFTVLPEPEAERGLLRVLDGCDFTTQNVEERYRELGLRVLKSDGEYTLFTSLPAAGGHAMEWESRGVESSVGGMPVVVPEEAASEAVDIVPVLDATSPAVRKPLVMVLDTVEDIGCVTALSQAGRLTDLGDGHSALVELTAAAAAAAGQNGEQTEGSSSLFLVCDGCTRVNLDCNGDDGPNVPIPSFTVSDPQAALESLSRDLGLSGGVPVEPALAPIPVAADENRCADGHF